MVDSVLVVLERSIATSSDLDLWLTTRDATAVVNVFVCARVENEVYSTRVRLWAGEAVARPRAFVARTNATESVCCNAYRVVSTAAALELKVSTVQVRRLHDIKAPPLYSITTA